MTDIKENMTSIEIDSISRTRIVSEMDKNFFVEAGAGSGKTTMLVNRMVAMVESGIDISKICAITFTKAAAGEFYERFQKVLIERSNPEYVWEDKGYAGQLPAPTKETRERAEEALRNIDLCFMGTIDAFCNMVLSEHPSEAGISSDATILTDADAETLYKQIYVKICEGKYGLELQELSGVFRKLFYNPEEVFVEGQSILMNNRNVHFNIKRSIGEVVDIDKKFAADREVIIKAMKCLVEHKELAYTNNKDSREAWDVIDDTAKKFYGEWSKDLIGVISGLNKLKELRVLPDALDKYGVSLADCFEPGGKTGKWLEFIPVKDGKLLGKINDFMYEIAMTFLIKSMSVIEQVMRDKGAMTYFDYLYYLKNMLKEDAKKEGKLIRYIYNRHSYFLIDEFQDTNPMQAEIFFYLTSKEPKEQWSACEPIQGSLFIVGDPKQSIYRFRGADVTSFLKVKRLFEANGGDILHLSRNFRSVKNLCAYFNEVFPKMFPEETEIQSKYEEIPLPEQDTDEFCGVYSYPAYIGEKLESEHPNMSDPEQIRIIINNLVGNEQYKISLENEEPRLIKYNDIMVIPYSKKAINPIMQELDKHGIPIRVEGKVPFGRNVALNQIYHLYQCVADPFNKMALYNALKTSFFNINDGEMMKLKLSGGELTITKENNISEDAHEETKKIAKKVDECLKQIKILADEARLLSPAALFVKIMDEFKVYSVAQAENLEILYYTLELLRNAEKTGVITSLKDGREYLSKLLSGEIEEERCLSLNDKKDCVHIANLHKVKGLEAPIVILSAKTKFGNNPTSRIVHDNDNTEGYIFEIKKKEKTDDDVKYKPLFSTEQFSAEKTKEEAAQSAEFNRLIYVAATRARNALIICNSIKSAFGKESYQSVWKPLIEGGTMDIFEKIGRQEKANNTETEEVKVASLYEKAEEESVLNNRDSEEKSFTLKKPSETKISSKITGDTSDVPLTADTDDTDGNEADSKEVSEVHKLPDLLGTMTHRLMEMIVSSGGTLNVDASVDEIIREYRTPRTQPYEAELSVALKEVANKIKNGGYKQTNGAPTNIVEVLLQAEECYTEVPFCYTEDTCGETTLWNGIMDVIYKKDDKWHIIDYKTNVDGTNLDAKYKGQLDAYKKAFYEITGEKVEDALIYHIDI